MSLLKTLWLILLIHVIKIKTDLITNDYLESNENT